MRRALILAVGLVALGVGTSWAALITNSDLLPPDGVYRTPGQVHAEYQAGANTFILQDILHFGFINTIRVPCGGTPVCEDEFFDSTVQGNLLINNVPSGSVSLTGPVTIHVEGKNSTGVPFQTEMLAMTLTGGGVTIRESPTLQSPGTTTITPLGGGQFRIDSFFDVFTELSLDGGSTWIPSTGSTRVELIPQPDTLLLVSSILLVIGVHRRFTRPGRVQSTSNGKTDQGGHRLTR